MRIAIALAVVFALNSSARAGNDVGVIVTGEGTTGGQLTAQFQNWLTQHGHRVVPTPLPADAFPLLDDCFVMTDPKACIRAIIEKRASSTSTIYAHVKSTNNTTNGTRDVALTTFWVDKGRDAHTESTTCESCTDELLRTTADAVLKKLAGSFVGHVKLKSTPEGAQIALDGQPPVGVTPLDVELPPGKHTIQLTSPGFEPQSREVVVIADQTITVPMDLLPKQDNDGNEPSRILPFSVIGAGIVLIGVGAFLFAIDEDSGYDKPKYIRDSAATGVELAIGGAVLIGAATAYLLWPRTPDAVSAPVVTLNRDAAYFGWSGRF
jgi:hypothetical protein